MAKVFFSSVILCLKTFQPPMILLTIFVQLGLVMLFVIQRMISKVRSFGIILLLRLPTRWCFTKKMYDQGIVYVKDLYDEQNNLLSLAVINRRFSIHNVPFTRIQGLINAIPSSWKRDLSLIDYNALTPFDSFHQTSFVSQWIYKTLIQSIGTSPIAIKKWEREFTFTDAQWQRIFKIPFNTLRESKIQYFQFRFLHRIIGTNHLLYLMKKRVNNLCTFCKSNDETLSHLFWDCRITSSFLLDIEQIVFGQQFILSRQDVFFGYKLYLLHPYNFLIFHLKYYIFNKKVNECIPKVDEFLNKFKFALQVEKSFSQGNSKRNVSFKSLERAFSFCGWLFL